MAKKRESTKLTKRERAEVFYGNGDWLIRGSKRLHLPPIRVSDGPFGLRIGVEGSSPNEPGANLVPATCYPSPALLACSFDEQLLEDVGKEMGKECRANGVDALLGPACNIKRNPLAGRNFDYYSEDPLLSGKMAAAFIRGIQSQGVGACLKHFACNSQERFRMVNNSIVDERALNEIYLKPFEIAVKESQPWMVMGSYNRINGVFSCDNKALLDDTLRKKWGFKGIVISDWGATPNFIYSHNNGLDVEMPGNVNRKAALMGAIRTGAIERKEHEASALRIQTILEKNKAAKDKPAEPFNALRSHEACVRAVEKSAVLLKNEGILPLKNFNKCCIIGELAEKPQYCGKGSSAVNPARPVSFLDAVRMRKPDIPYREGYDFLPAINPQRMIEALDVASNSEKVILFLGLNPGTESEGYDREDLQIPVEQRRLFDEIYAVNQNIIVVLNVGAPIELPFKDKAKAIFLTYLPGEAAGEALVKLLLNEVCPSGKLAESWPVHLLDVPSFGYFPGSETQSLYRESVYVGYRFYVSVTKKEKKNPLPTVAYPFGHGLTYARIGYGDFTLSSNTISKDKTIYVSLEVANHSKFPAEHVIQIYANPDRGNVFMPDRFLIAFRKIALEANSKQTVVIPIDYMMFSHYDKDSKRFLVEGGGCSLEVGNSSMDIALSKRIRIISEDTFPSLQYSLPVYYNPGSDGFLSYDNNFEALLGHEVPLEKDPHSRPYTLNSTISDISSTKIGKKLIREAKETLGSMIEEKLHYRTLMELPLRGLSMQGVSAKRIKAILYMANGQYIMALLETLFGSGKPPKPKKEKTKKVA